MAISPHTPTTSQMADILASRAREFWVAVGAVGFMGLGLFGTWATILGAISVSGINTDDGKVLIVMAAAAAWCLFRYATQAGRRNLVVAGVLGVVACGIALYHIADLSGQGPLVGVGWALYVEAIAAGVLAVSAAKLLRCEGS